MAQATTKDLTTLPVGRLGLIPLISCKDLGEKVNEWLIQWRKERSHEELDSFAFEGYQRDSYLIPVRRRLLLSISISTGETWMMQMLSNVCVSLPSFR